MAEMAPDDDIAEMTGVWVAAYEEALSMILLPEPLVEYAGERAPVQELRCKERDATPGATGLAAVPPTAEEQGQEEKARMTWAAGGQGKEGRAGRARHEGGDGAVSKPRPAAELPGIDNLAGVRRSMQFMRRDAFGAVFADEIEAALDEDVDGSEDLQSMLRHED